jgi:nickel-type superoxide dismutase maturation protease
MLGSAALLAWAFDRVEVVGTSMTPTFVAGDRLLLVRRWRSLRVGDLVALRDPTSPGRSLVKRVATLEAGSASVVGDNEAASTDSRSFGAVPVASIRHLVVRRYARAGAT